MFLSVLLIAGVIITPLAVNSVQYAPQVTIESGKIRGLLVNLTTGDVARKYLGIPFAKAERFGPPTPPESWNEVKNMISIGKACPQILHPVWSSKVEDMSEDCLNLNVFVPHEASSSPPLPVMVWIHGGAFVLGSNKLYDGSYIATLGKVIVVVINYRVSVFGFITNGKHGDLKGNYGMLDQLQALKWVNKSIKAFGGDPAKVTIFGESAGGASVSLLRLSPLSKGLFHRVISQSGEASAPWVTGRYDSLAKSIQVLAKNLGCPQDLGKLKECLKPKTFKQIIDASATVPFPSFIPVVDGHFLPDAPSILLEKGEFGKVDIMAGVTDDEGIVFTNAIPGLSVGLNVTHGVSREAFIKTLKGGALSLIIPDPKSLLVDTTIYRYTDWTDISSPLRNRRMYVDLMSDNMFIAPAIETAKAYAKKTAVTYLYQLQYRSDRPIFGLKIPSWVRANHGADILFVFGGPLLSNATKDANFSREVIKLWTNFAKTGNPNTPVNVGGISWPQYNHDQQKYLALKPNMAVASHLRAEFVAFWNHFIPDALRSKPTKAPPSTKAPSSTKAPPCKVPSDAVRQTTGTSLLLLLSMGLMWFL